MPLVWLISEPPCWSLPPPHTLSLTLPWWCSSSGAQGTRCLENPPSWAQQKNEGRGAETKEEISSLNCIIPHFCRFNTSIHSSTSFVTCDATCSTIYFRRIELLGDFTDHTCCNLPTHRSMLRMENQMHSSVWIFGSFVFVGFWWILHKVNWILLS